MALSPTTGAEKNNLPHVTCAGVFIKASGADGERKNQKVIEGIKIYYLLILAQSLNG